VRASLGQPGLPKKALALSASRELGSSFFELSGLFGQSFFKGTGLFNSAAPLSHGVLLELLETAQEPHTPPPVPVLKLK
jgi:hypothetical protein